MTSYKGGVGNHRKIKFGLKTGLHNDRKNCSKITKYTLSEDELEKYKIPRDKNKFW